MKIMEKQNKIAELIISVMIMLYTIAMLALGAAGGDFFYIGMTDAERFVFWSVTAVGVCAFFLAAIQELRFNGRQPYRMFCMFALCIGFVPLIADAFNVLQGSDILLRVALGFVALGLILASVSRRNSLIAFAAVVLTLLSLVLPRSEPLMRAWIVLLFLLPVLSAAFTRDFAQKQVFIRIPCSLVCSALCVTGYVWNRSFYAAAAVACMLYVGLCIWLNAGVLKSMAEQEKAENSKRESALKAAAATPVSEASKTEDIIENNTQTAPTEAEPEPAAPAETAVPVQPETVAEAPSAEVNETKEKHTVAESTVQEFALTDKFDGVVAFLLDKDGKWYRYVRSKQDILPCDDSRNPFPESLIEKDKRVSVAQAIKTQDTCEIPCRMWDNRQNTYINVLVKSVTRPDGRKYVLIFDTSAATTQENKRITALEQEVNKLNAIIDAKDKDERRTFFAVNEFLISLIERRSEESVKHLNNISLCTSILMKKAQELYPEMEITDEFVRDVSDASIFHDVGKIEVPDAVLTKKGRFTPEEYEEMKKHTVYGGEIINRMPYAKSQEQIMKYSYEIATKHHERVDGKGYPLGLTEKDIPFYVQIVSLADVFEALVSKRVYKDPIPFEKTIQMIESGESGTFSDKIIKCLEASREELKNAQLV